jgi:hypothetical protein
MAIKRPDTPLAPTPEPITDRVQSVMESREKQINGKYSALNKEKVTIDSSDGSSSAQFTKQTDKENGKQKFKQYNVIRDKDGNSTMQIDVKTNRGADRTRTITNPKKIERKLERVLRRNEM